MQLKAISSLVDFLLCYHVPFYFNITQESRGVLRNTRSQLVPERIFISANLDLTKFGWFLKNQSGFVYA